MQVEDKRLNVVIIAYACEPNRGSEPGTAWNIVTRLSEFCNVSVIRRANNESVIMKELSINPRNSLSFKYVDPSRSVLKLKKIKVLPVQLFYGLWQRSVAKRLKQKGEFDSVDIVHQMTFNSFEVPPFIFTSKSDSKYVWGPIGGGQSVKWRLLKIFGFKGAIKEFLRNIRVKISSFNPLCVKSLKNTSLVYFANYDTRSLLERHCRGKIEMMIDVGVDIEKFKPGVKKIGGKSPPVVLFAGRLEGRKGVMLLLKALEKLIDKGSKIECRIVGAGPQEHMLKTYIEKKGIKKNVIMLGLVSHSQMSEEFAKADMFAFPSLRDTSGSVVLEAMSMEIPSICFNHQGGAVMLNDECGIRIETSNVKQMINELAESMDELSGNPEKRLAMGRAARARVESEYDWNVRVQRTLMSYKQILNYER